ncbi:PelD GGDEF domain-containing protein [Granulosicoccus sp. 3-233]|uniref:PelD GGDEF domain-containing protein n=1 Tax=Granulosicoccus sp. 3-233 TaxID=3417969 RepID=UPI003D32CF31
MKPFLAVVSRHLRIPSGRIGTRVVELLFFACVLPLAGLLVFADDPTGLQAGFPWAVAGALVFAARYGSLWGVLCAVLTGLVIHLPLFAPADAGGQNAVLALGAVIMSLIVGDAASSWRTRSQQSEAENQYLRHRLKEFSSDYHVLKVSHGQLEEHMAGQRLSLREALQRLKPVLSASGDGLQAGSELMAVFSQFCSIQVAGLYAMSSDTRVDPQPVATHGDMFELPLFDPILRTAIRERELVSIKLESLDEKHHENSLLAVVPLVDTNGRMHGVLAIKDMHFMAFQQQNLNILALLGNYMGDMLTRSKGAAESRAAWFMTELDTALRFAHSHSTESVLLSLRFNGEASSGQVARYVSTAIRSLDASWLLAADDDAPVLCLLLPLMSESQGQAFLQRINKVVTEEFGHPLKACVEGMQLKSLRSGDSRALCLAFLSKHTGKAALLAELHGSTDGSDVAGSRSDVA